MIIVEGGPVDEDEGVGLVFLSFLSGLMGFFDVPAGVPFPAGFGLLFCSSSAVPNLTCLFGFLHHALRPLFVLVLIFDL